ncbi:MAG: hypothetical protein LUE21_07105 [Oscillospiraceae bacterium]|nr:hypothetical protein [Oscillospiraceae bacterium]
MARRPLRMDSPHNIRLSITKVANEVRDGRLSPSQANAIICAANAILSSIRTDEQRRKIQELEKILESYGKKEN